MNRLLKIAITVVLFAMPSSQPQLHAMAGTGNVSKATVFAGKNTCHEYGYQTSYPSNLTVHMRTDTSKKPIACEECGKDDL